MKKQYYQKKHDQGKLRWDLVDLETIEELAKILTYGVKKYSANSWQTVPEAKNRYWAAMMRHVKAHQAGEVRDPESGLDHLSHAFCNLYFLIWLNKHSNPKSSKTSKRT